MLDGDLDVPVVGRDDAHRVDVLSIEHLAVVAVDVGPLALARTCAVVFGAIRMVRVHVANGHDVAETSQIGAVCMHRSPVPISPRMGRSFAAALAKASWVQAKYGAALPGCRRRCGCASRNRGGNVDSGSWDNPLSKDLLGGTPVAGRSIRLE